MGFKETVHLNENPFVRCHFLLWNTKMTNSDCSYCLMGLQFLKSIIEVFTVKVVACKSQMEMEVITD